MNFAIPSIVIALAALSADGATLPTSPYREAARTYAEALLAHGRDHYGPVHTPMFVHTIDLRTLEIPKQRTAAEWRTEMSTWKEDKNYLMWGKDRSSVLWAQDSNLLWDTENIRLLNALTKETGDPRFADAAEQYMAYFLKHCVSRTTGLFAWGEHIAYNVLDDQIHGQRHELQHPSPLWEEMWKLDPDKVRNEIEGVYRYHITDKRSMAYDRHANFWNGLPERDQATIIGYFATYADAFAFLYQKTHDPKYEEWARKLLMSFQSKSNADGLYSDNWTDRQAREMPEMYPVRPNLADGMYSVFEKTGRAEWLDDANRYLESCDRVLESGRAVGDDKVFGPVRQADAAIHGYELTGKPEYLAIARRAGDEILGHPQPHAQMASTLAGNINTVRRLYEITGEQQWLDGARKLGDYALKVFVHPSGLIRGTAVVDRPDYYDAIQGPGTLALALYDLGGVKVPATPVHPARKTGDIEPPALADLEFPKLASNQERVPVSVRIKDASGVKYARLLYAYGNEVGFADATPEVSDGRYTFHIEPAGLSYLDQVSFAVEAVDASPNGNRAMSKWNHLRLGRFENGSPSAGAIRFPEVGVTLTQAASSGPVHARLINVPPDGTQGLKSGWVSTSRYVCLDREVQAGGLTIAYATEDTWRLIGSTLTLAYWDGTDWRRVPSKLDTRSHTVSAKYEKAACWTVVGEDRVLWRTGGRHGGVALADLEGDGTRDVVTAHWQPGESISSKGASLQNFPIDPPYHPLANPSPPIVAQLRKGQEQMLLFGAPAGYVCAYDRSGKLHWRTEVGGEILGGVAVGRINDGPDLSVVASWNGGAAAIDSAGKKLWQKDIETPSGSVPVLVDLNDDGKLDIVLNSGSKIIAMRGDTGELLWSYSFPGASFTTPAVGQFTTMGKPRIVTGDDQGTVYALDESGKLLWRQTRIYGPREVPEQIDQYSAISEIGMADLDRSGERQIVAATKSGETVALNARGERLWRFSSYERKVGTSLARGAHLAFADLDNDGRLEVILAQQDSYLYVLDSAGREKWTYLGYFWYHNSPSIADLQNTGELDIVFTAPEENGTYALRSGFKGEPGRAPWPMDRGNLERTNCAPW